MINRLLRSFCRSGNLLCMRVSVESSAAHIQQSTGLEHTMENKQVCDASNTLNYSQDPSGASNFLYNKTTLAMRIVVMPLILAIGLLGNLAFLFVVTRVRSMRTVTNMYLTNLAVADISFLLLSIGNRLLQYLLSPIPGDQAYMGLPGCSLVYFLQHVSNWTSIFIITLVSMEKYYAVCYPLKHILLHSFPRTKKLIISAWSVGVVLSAAMIPAHYNMYYYCIVWPVEIGTFSDFPDVIGVCAGIPGNLWLGNFSNFFQTIPFVCTFLFNGFAYTQIIRRLKQRSRDDSLSKEVMSKNTRVRNQVSIMLIANGVAFFICLAPFQLLCLSVGILDLTGEVVNFEVFVHIAQIMLYLNSTLNPYIYNATSSVYRQAFRDAFTGRKSARRRWYLKTRRHGNGTPSQPRHNKGFSMHKVTSTSPTCNTKCVECATVSNSTSLHLQS
ncbi:thyrotropin-releasing hormone receptor-like [Asterias rubens]|uniref:thyrotropin-releasing hormone receptor-like n=1 Tax=Asterias rubens TaxID=7604 RepID=UPI00145525A1|nr:thyrotropin-releasing hormone receptor-like [Asterias rubens]